MRRRTDKQLPTYDDANDRDTFLVGGDEELVPVLHEVTVEGVTMKEPLVVSWPAVEPTERRERYCPRVEGGFARIERVTRLDAVDALGAVPFWRVTTRDNVVTEYGRSAAARISDPDDLTRVLEWLAERTWNDKGDVTVTVYALEDGAGVDPRRAPRAQPHRCAYAQRYLKRIWYGNRERCTRPRTSPPALTARTFCFEVVFDYGEHATTRRPRPRPATASLWAARQDAFSTYRGGFELRTQRLCRRVLMFHRIESATTPVLVATPPSWCTPTTPPPPRCRR